MGSNITEAKKRYNKKNTRAYFFRLNLKTDADIIQHLNGKRYTTYIKELIRNDMKRS